MRNAAVVRMRVKFEAPETAGLVGSSLEQNESCVAGEGRQGQKGEKYDGVLPHSTALRVRMTT